MVGRLEQVRFLNSRDECRDYYCYCYPSMVYCFPVLIGLLLFGGSSEISQKTALLFFDVEV